MSEKKESARAQNSVVLYEIGKLKSYDRNARVHSTKQIHQIAASIQEFGFNNPVLIDHAGTIIAGHGRVEAARHLGLTEVPTILIEHLTDTQKRAYILADNRLAQNAKWDPEILRIELQFLVEDVSFDVEVTGFETAEIDVLLDGQSNTGADAADDVPNTAQVAITRVGDLWELGNHKIICADALKPETYDVLLDVKACMVFTDPPYNVRIDGHVSGLGRTKHREFSMAAGEMSAAQFEDFLRTVLSNLARATRDGGIHFVCMDWRHAQELLAAAAPSYSELKNICVWNKTNGGMGSFYRSKHEFVFVFKVGTAPHLNNFGLGQAGRYRTNVWDYAGANVFGKHRIDELAMHPTVKPVALVADAIKDCSKRGDVVLDAFAGSGTTVIAAERTQRRARAIEIDPLYVDVAVRRWEALTGRHAVHAISKRTFRELAAERASENEGDRE